MFGFLATANVIQFFRFHKSPTDTDINHLQAVYSQELHLGDPLAQRMWSCTPAASLLVIETRQGRPYSVRDFELVPHC
jgi:hypothetical protein